MGHDDAALAGERSTVHQLVYGLLAVSVPGEDLVGIGHRPGARRRGQAAHLHLDGLPDLLLVTGPYAGLGHAPDHLALLGAAHSTGGEGRSVLEGPVLTPAAHLEARDGYLPSFAGWHQNAGIGGAVLTSAHELLTLDDQDGPVGGVVDYEMGNLGVW